uniref:Uncharacterized protein n=1 Tax=Anopheles culicifacies TaxID=139723 RepID=A0A182MNM1_9DIPT
MIGAPSGFGAVRPANELAAARLAASVAWLSMRESAAAAAAAIFHRSSLNCCGSKLKVLSAGATLVVESRYVPLMMASSISCRFFSSSSPSACGTSSFFTSSSARFSLIEARFSVSSTVITLPSDHDLAARFLLELFGGHAARAEDASDEVKIWILLHRDVHLLVHGDRFALRFWQLERFLRHTIDVKQGGTHFCNFLVQQPLHVQENVRERGQLFAVF